MLEDLKKRISAAFDSARSQGPTSLVPPKPPEPEVDLVAEFSEAEAVPVVSKPRIYSERHEQKFLRRAKALCETAIKDPNVSTLRQHYRSEKSFYVGSIDGPINYTQAIEAALEILGKDSNEPKKGK